MARLIGPDMGSRAVFLPSGAPAADRTGVVYADAAGTVLADIRVYDGTVTPGAAYAGSVVTVDAYGLLPLVWFPDGDVDRVWITVNGGPLTPIDADYNARLDTVTQTANAAETPAGAQAKADAAQAAAITDATTKYAAVFPVAAPTGNAATDTAAIQSAIDAAAAAGGGIVALANGTYALSASLTMKTGVALVGSSSENVTLQLANGANTSVITSAGFAGLTGTQPVDPDLTASGPSGWAIRGVEIVGNQANQAGTSWGVRVFGYGYVIDDVRIRDCLSGGMFTEFAHSGPYNATPTGVEARFVNLRIHHNGGTGWHMRGPNDSHAIGCMIWENTGFGLWAQTIAGVCSANGLNLFNCHAYGSGHTWGMVFDAQVMATSCQSEGASVGQVWMRYPESVWVGGAIYDINPAGGNGLGLRLGDTSTSTFAVRCYVATLLTGWTGADAAHAAVDFAQTSNCWVDGRVQLTTATGTAINGTPDPSDVVALAVSGASMSTATALQRSVFKQRGQTTFDVGVNSQGFRLANQFTDYFNLNTNATPPRFELPNGVQWRMYAGAYTSEKLRLDGAVGHIEAISTTVPGVAAAAGLGTTPPAVVVDTNSNDMRGLVNFGTGTAPATGAAVTVTFATAFSRAPTVMLIAKNGSTAALQPYLGAISATSFNINLAVAPAAGQAAGTYFVAYMVMG